MSADTYFCGIGIKLVTKLPPNGHFSGRLRSDKKIKLVTERYHSPFRSVFHANKDGNFSFYFHAKLYPRVI